MRRGRTTSRMENMNALMRPRQGRLIAGVCAAVANRFGWNVTLVRVLTVIAVVFFGLSLWAYILLWILIPNEL
ncbi:PspC domain-containing protein [Microbacterium sp. NEAU-LLC]|uniref:PspC domain-containing protein n=2 Tax=Microbacterium helvum TaxID=2773713 RepID=A0ABR8NU77_9MICO|nr:PspC domain-containing protein [Microbacterium helvum]